MLLLGALWLGVTPMALEPLWFWFPWAAEQSLALGEAQTRRSGDGLAAAATGRKEEIEQHKLLQFHLRFLVRSEFCHTSEKAAAALL